MPGSYLSVFFGKISIQFLCLFLNQILCLLILRCMSSLYICKYFLPFSSFSFCVWFCFLCKSCLVWCDPYVYVCLSCPCTWCDKFIEFHCVTCSCPLFPTPFTEEIVFTPSYILASFIIDWPYKCGFISEFSLLFPWSIYLFLCQYHIAVITVIL